MQKNNSKEESWENDPKDIKAFEESIKLDKQREKEQKETELANKLAKQKKIEERKAKLQLEKIANQKLKKVEIPEEDELDDDIQEILFENALLNKRTTG